MSSLSLSGKNWVLKKFNEEEFAAENPEKNYCWEITKLYCKWICKWI